MTRHSSSPGQCRRRRESTEDHTKPTRAHRSPSTERGLNKCFSAIVSETWDGQEWNGVENVCGWQAIRSPRLIYRECLYAIQKIILVGVPIAGWIRIGVPYNFDLGTRTSVEFRQLAHASRTFSYKITT